MIRWNKCFAALALAAFALTGCTDGQLPMEPQAAADAPAAVPLFNGTTGGIVVPEPVPQKVADLFAGQFTDVGDVFVSNDAVKVTVTFEIDEGWCMTESHVQVASSPDDIPQKNGNPIPGKFEKKAEYTECTDSETFEFPLADLGGPGVGDAVYVAVHAVVWDESSETTEYFASTAGDPVFGPLASYAGLDEDWGTEKAAVAAWVHSNWPSITGATWISTRNEEDNPPAESEPLAEDYVNDSWRKFTKTIDVPGWPTGGGITDATADNAEEVFFNGVSIGSDGELSGPSSDDQEWGTINAYPFTPSMGSNELAFIVRNYGLESGTPTSNPTGLIYKGFVSYYEVSETAWAGTAVGETPFPGANWATYFQYTIQGVCPDVDSYANVTIIGPPASVAPGQSENSSAQLFEEGVTQVPAGVEVDEGSVGEESFVCTYYLHADADGSSLERISGSLTFAEDILALAYTGSTAITNTACDKGLFRLYDTDADFGFPGTTYPSFASANHRGLECGDQDGTPPFLDAGTPKQLAFDVGVAEATDGFRIFLPALP
ncbi:MAG: hypothetical protein RRA92_08325 [Gemmatimonadota bacterium]|nr:hypothetical protein [Gemmatimonadota bacterium]